MGKALEGAALLAGAVGLGVAAFFDPALIASPFFDKLLGSLVLGGISLEAGAIAGALTSNRGMNISSRQSAAARQIIYGQQRVGGVEIYRSTTGSHHDQFNYVIVLAGHVCDSIVNLYLDGRQVHFQAGYGNTTRNGVNFGGSADSNTYTGPNGVRYNFGGKVYCEARYGDQLPGDVISGLTANDPKWAASSAGSPYVGGCTYVYLKIEYDTNVFPGEPEIRFTVNGKQVYDPRTGTTAFSSNWALICADILTDPVFGLGDNTVNTAQLIAAANVCDEQVPLAIGGTEARYCTHYHYDTTVGPGDVLSTMMAGAAGRLSRIGGEWFIWPAYYQGPSFSFDQSALTGTMSWTPYRSYRDLFNRVNGTYVAPNYPYNISGNLYDVNGFYDGQIQNNFPFAFQPTNYPQYAADTLHGYASDEFLTADGGVQLPKELALSTVLSVSQAQRVAKITLLRNRQQGSGSFPMRLSAWQMQPLDVMQFTFSENGWTNKLLEVTGVQFKVADAGDGVQSVRCEMSVQETDPSVYDWSIAEELTVYDVPSTPTQTPYTPAAPTNMSLISGAQTEITGPDGIARPRIEVTWNAPLDVLTKQIQIQYALNSTPVAWIDAGSVDVGLNIAYIAGVITGLAYNVRIRSVRANGAFSDWLEEDNYTVSDTGTRIGSVYLNPNSPYNSSNTSVIDSIPENSSATMRVNGPGGDPSSFERLTGGVSFTIPGAHITGLSFSTLYYINYILTYYNAQTHTLGGYLDASTDYNSTLSDSVIYIGARTTCDAGYVEGGTTGGGSTPPGGGGGGTRGGDLTMAASTE